MEKFSEFWAQPQTISDLRPILLKLKNLDLENIDKKVLKVLLSGFSIIVKNYEETQMVVEGGTYEEIILDWMRVFLDIQELVVSSPSHRIMFSKCVPVAVTYIIGCIFHVSNVSSQFYSNFLIMTLHLLSQMDERTFLKLEVCSKGLISYLWTIIDKVGNFNTQRVLLNIIHIILKNFDSKNALIEIESFPNLSATTKEKIFDLLKVDKDTLLYKKLCREILNEHNSRQGQKSLVHTFFCEKICIGDKFIFMKTKDYDKFWFDINIQPYTFTFSGLLTTNCMSFPRNVDVSLRIKKFYCNSEKLNIEFEPPPVVSGFKIPWDELEDTTNAYAVLPEIERRRIFKIFKANTLTLNRNEYPKKDHCQKPSQSPNEDDSILASDIFKKPSLDLFESSSRKRKTTLPLLHIPSKSQKIQEPTNQITTPTDTGSGTQASLPGKRRFFKSPRPPRKIEIPWKLSFARLPIKVNKNFAVRQKEGLNQGKQLLDNYQHSYSANKNLSNKTDSVSMPNLKRSSNDGNVSVEGKRHRSDTTLDTYLRMDDRPSTSRAAAERISV